MADRWIELSAIRRIRLLLIFLLVTFSALNATLLIFQGFASKIVLQANKLVYEFILLSLKKVISPVNFVQICVNPLHCQLFCLYDRFVFFGGWMHVLQVSFAQISWHKTESLIETQFIR